jgi:hypothetical protein
MIDTVIIYPLKKGGDTFQKIFGSKTSKRPKKEEGQKTDKELMDEENSQERKKYMEVSGLAAL